MMDRAWPVLKRAVAEVWKFIRGRSYSRFAAFLICLGISLVCDFNLVEIFVNLFVDWFRKTRELPPQEPYDVNYWIEFILGIILIGSGLWTFFHFENLRHDTEGINKDLQRDGMKRIKEKWSNMVDIYSKKAASELGIKPNEEDICKAISGINEAAAYCNGNALLEDDFFKSHGDDYVKLFKRLEENEYELTQEDRNSSEMLTVPAREMFESYRIKLEG